MTTSSSGEQQTMYHRRATSLGKGQLRTAGGNALAAARLARTSSWSNGLDNNSNSSVISVPQQQEETGRFRCSRPSMRRMVRFRMSSSSSDIDPSSAAAAVAGPSGKSTTNVIEQLGNAPPPQPPLSPRQPVVVLVEEEPPSAVSPPLPAGVEAGTQTASNTNRPSSSNNVESIRPVLVRQVSRFSVMQTPEESLQHRPLEAVPSVASTVLSFASSIDGPSTTSGGRRQRGRHGRSATSNGHSRARRQRSNMSSVSGTSTRASTPDTPVLRSRRRNRNADGNVDPEEESRRKLVGIWPHSLSPMFALLAATLGLFNISRFAILTIEYGGNFIVQFVILSFLFGIPMICFHASLGQFLGSNVIDMWRISPIFKGVGIALLLGQALSGLYSLVGVAWMFFYFRDSFIAQEDRYKWSKCNDMIRGCIPPTNYTFGLEETIPDYFHAKVLQRSNPSVPPVNFVSLKFELAFNLAVIWMIIFVALGKGLRSYGKVVYAFGTLPLLGYFVVCVKVLGYSSSIPNLGGIGGVLDRTPWNEFFIDTKVWVVAAREVFMTWGVCGAIVMQIASHNRYNHPLRRDVTIVIALTLFTLLLSGFLASACLQILNFRGPYDYRTDSSFETDKSYRFLKSLRFMRQQPQYGPISQFQELHNNLVMGVAVRREDYNQEDGADLMLDRSGYQPIRLATELLPAVVAVIGPMEFSPFWAVLFYFSLVAFGIAQQLATWHCLISGIVAFRSCCLKAWETTITFTTCLLGFLFSLPLATELGISIVYHLDYVVGSMWWLMIIYVIQIAAVLIVRGRPYNGESIVAVLIKGPGCLANWAVPMLTFSWSVVLPIGLLVLSISSLKTGAFSDMFNWNTSQGYAFWPLWARQTGTMLQLIPIMLIPAVGIIQCIRYLSTGPSDLFERIKLLYRPPFRTYLIPPEANGPSNHRSRSSRSHQGRSRRAHRSRSRSPSPSLVNNPPGYQDPPPKYTPPPTYNTATGARIAKMLRESIRRSIRQIREMATPIQSPGNTVTCMAELELNNHPPTYTSVIMELHRHGPDDSNVDSSNTSSETMTENSASIQASSSSITSSSDNGLTRLLRESFRRSARNVNLRQSFRFMRNSSPDNGSSSKPAAVHRRSSTDDELMMSSETDQAGSSSVVVNLPDAADHPSESVA